MKTRAFVLLRSALTAAACTLSALPAWSQSPGGELDAVVRMGKEIFDHTAVHPLSQPYVGAQNALNCTSCHLASGTSLHGPSLVGSATAYPAYSPRDQAVLTLESRIADCFMRSQNGIHPPLGSAVLTALTAYISSLSAGLPMKMNPAAPLGPLSMKWILRGDEAFWKQSNPQRGQALYSQRCAGCHGADGQGMGGGMMGGGMMGGGMMGGGMMTFPPIWGPRSFNAGAGLADWQKLATFISTAMAQYAGPVTDADARDIAAFVDSQPRPAFVLKDHLPPANQMGVYDSGVVEQTQRIVPGSYRIQTRP
ncbi:MAG: c-type cytochrome [Burkholderiaceae bacterium]